MSEMSSGQPKTPEEIIISPEMQQVLNFYKTEKKELFKRHSELNKLMESGNTDNRVIIEAKATFLAYTLGTTVINLIEQGEIKTKDDVDIKYRELLDKHKKDTKYKIVFEAN